MVFSQDGPDKVTVSSIMYIRDGRLYCPTEFTSIPNQRHLTWVRVPLVESKSLSSQV